MDIQKARWKVTPDGEYSVRKAARYLGVHRCTIYAYIKLTERPLPYYRLPNNRMVFSGIDLIVFKANGLPKMGRKNKYKKKSNATNQRVFLVNL